jgi:anti-sigma regulatory factor (Ser/Thr protein kinase)
MRCHTVEFPAKPERVRDARDWVRALLHPGTPASVVGDALLAVSEVATNAVRHSTGPRFRLDAGVSPTSLYVECCDGGGPTAPRIPEVGPDDENGRGLRLVAAVCTMTGFLPSRPGVFFFLDWSRGASDRAPHLTL